MEDLSVWDAGDPVKRPVSQISIFSAEKIEI
jgi:hypothetical protein